MEFRKDDETRLVNPLDLQKAVVTVLADLKEYLRAEVTRWVDPFQISTVPVKQLVSSKGNPRAVTILKEI